MLISTVCVGVDASSHSFFRVCVFVCTHSGIIASCLSWLEMVSLIPLHHMSGFICVLCQELMEFFARLALKVFEDTRPDLMQIQPPAILLLIDLLSFVCSIVVVCFSILKLEFISGWNMSVLSRVGFRSFHYTSLHPSKRAETLTYLSFFYFKQKDMGLSHSAFPAAPNCLFVWPPFSSSHPV